MNYLYSALAGVLAVLMIFHGGRIYERGVIHEAEIAQLKEDAVDATAIAEEDKREHIKVVENVRTVEKLVPMDNCYYQPMPAAILDGLRDAGFRAGQPADR